MDAQKGLGTFSGVVFVVGLLSVAVGGCGFLATALADKDFSISDCLNAVVAGIVLMAFSKLLDLFIEIAKNIQKIADKP